MRRSQGFTAVELLVTLFVATAFMAASYQLYSTIVRESGDVRSRARAGNIAYAELRRQSDTSIALCIPMSRTTFTIPEGHQLDTPTGFVEVICRSDRLMEVRTEVRYGPSTNQQEVKYAVLVAK